MAKTKDNRSIRVGLLISGALLILMVFLFFIGSEQTIFARKNEYEVRLENVTGLSQGNPVRMSGVTIGTIRDIKLPKDPKQKQVEILLMIDRSYAERIRGDSRARLKKLGLLTGDSNVDVSAGTPRFPILEPGSLIPAQRGTDVEALITSGEDLVENLVQISFSLKNILQRVDRGEGSPRRDHHGPGNEAAADRYAAHYAQQDQRRARPHGERQRRGGQADLRRQVRPGADRLDLRRGESMQVLTAKIQQSFESGEGAVPALLNDPAGKQRVYELIENLHTSSANLATFTASMQKGEGLVPRLLNDKAYGDEALSEFAGLIRQLNEVVAKINKGEGTAGKLIADPTVYESVNDILIGINESKLLRWLIRSRQQAGIEKRAGEQKKGAGGGRSRAAGRAAGRSHAGAAAGRGRAGPSDEHGYDGDVALHEGRECAPHPAVGRPLPVAMKLQRGEG